MDNCVGKCSGLPFGTAFVDARIFSFFFLHLYGHGLTRTKMSNVRRVGLWGWQISRVEHVILCGGGMCWSLSFPGHQ